MRITCPPGSGSGCTPFSLQGEVPKNQYIHGLAPGPQISLAGLVALGPSGPVGLTLAALREICCWYLRWGVTVRYLVDNPCQQCSLAWSWGQHLHGRGTLIYPPIYPPRLLLSAWQRMLQHLRYWGEFSSLWTASCTPSRSCKWSLDVTCSVQLPVLYMYIYITLLVGEKLCRVM